MDIKKAFDTIWWTFLLKVLESFGFSDWFCRWIDTIFLSTRVFMLFNVSPKGYFSCYQGVHRGDPLSLFLFGLVEDFLSQYLSFLVTSSSLIPMISPMIYYMLMMLFFFEE